MRNLVMDNTPDTVLERLFRIHVLCEMWLAPDDVILLYLLGNLDYSRFDSSLHRSANVRPRKMCMYLLYAYMNDDFSLIRIKTFCSSNVFALYSSAMVRASTIRHRAVS